MLTQFFSVGLVMLLSAMLRLTLGFTFATCAGIVHDARGLAWR